MTIKHFELFFQSLQNKHVDDLKRVVDAIASLNQHIETAEKLVEEGNKLLKLCVSKMNWALFLQGQQLELKLELKSELASENKKKKELSTMKWFFILFFVLFVMLSINDAKIFVFQYIWCYFFFSTGQYFQYRAFVFISFCQVCMFET